MKTRLLFVAAALAAASLAGPTAAKPAESGDAAITDDVHCLFMGFMLSQDSDPKTKGFGQAASLFYWGRLEGRGALDGLQARIIQHADWATPGALADAARTCGAEMSQAGKEMLDLGDRLKAMDAGAR